MITRYVFSNLFLPPEIGNLKNLTHLTTACYEMSDLPSEIKKLTNLEELDIVSRLCYSSEAKILYEKEIKKKIPKCNIHINSCFRYNF